MSNFVIPKGIDYSFTIKVLEEDSFLPQNLDTFDPTGSNIKLVLLEGFVDSGITVDLTKIAEDPASVTPAVEEVTTLSIIEVARETYSITIGNTVYSLEPDNVWYTIDASMTPAVEGDIVASLVLEGAASYVLDVDEPEYEIIGNDIVLTALGEINILSLPAIHLSINYGADIVFNSGDVAPITNIPADTAAVASALGAKLTVLPANITVDPIVDDTIVLRNATGDIADISYSDNIVRSAYTAGTEEIPASTFYNDNGYLKGTFLGADTASLTEDIGEAVDNYPLKPTYQGILTINFTDLPTRTAIIESVYIRPTGA